MKTFGIALVTLLLSTFSLSAQEYTASNEGWLVDLNEAYEEQEKTGKPIMANFTGSDWCGWCRKLKAAVFDTPQFKEWAEENVVLLELDFPRRMTLPEPIKQQNYSLQQGFGVTGYPTVWLFRVEKNKETNQMNVKAMGKTGYKPTAEAFIQEADRIISTGS